MARKSSLNFQKAKANSVDELTREFEAHYLLSEEHRKYENVFLRLTDKTDKELFAEEVKKCRTSKPKFENCRWEAVVNLDEQHNPQIAEQKLKELINYIETELEFKATNIAIHYDEGHLIHKETGEALSSGKDFYYNPEDNKYYKKHIWHKGNKATGTKGYWTFEGEINKDEYEAKHNYHAHISFFTFTQGKQRMRNFLVRPKLRALQTKTAQILEMERGEDNRISKTERIATQAFRNVATERERNLSNKEVKNVIQKFINDNKGKGFQKDFFQELHSLKKAIKEIKYKELEELLGVILEKHKAFAMLAFEDYETKEATIKALKEKNAELQNVNENLQSKMQALENDLNSEKQKNDLQATSEASYKAQIEELKAKLEKAQETNGELKKELEKLKNQEYTHNRTEMPQKSKNYVQEYQKVNETNKNDFSPQNNNPQTQIEPNINRLEQILNRIKNESQTNTEPQTNTLNKTEINDFFAQMKKENNENAKNQSNTDENRRENH